MVINESGNIFANIDTMILRSLPEHLYYLCILYLYYIFVIYLTYLVYFIYLNTLHFHLNSCVYYIYYFKKLRYAEFLLLATYFAIVYSFISFVCRIIAVQFKR